MVYNSSGIINTLGEYLNPSSAWWSYKLLGNPSSENEIPPVVSNGNKILLRTSLILIFTERSRKLWNEFQMQKFTAEITSTVFLFSLHAKFT